VNTVSNNLGSLAMVATVLSLILCLYVVMEV